MAGETDRALTWGSRLASMIDPKRQPRPSDFRLPPTGLPNCGVASEMDLESRPSSPVAWDLWPWLGSRLILSLLSGRSNHAHAWSCDYHACSGA